MRSWFRYGKTKDVQSRTVQQQAWDAAILCAAEYVRRRLNYDEVLALELHNELLTWKQGENDETLLPKGKK